MEQQNFKINEVTIFSLAMAETIKHLAQQEGKNYRELSDNDLKEIIESPVTHLFIVEDSLSQKIVGMVTLLICRIPYVRKATMEDLVIDKFYRGRGLGTLLIGKVIKEAEEKGAAYLDFTSRPRRVDGNSMYEKLGFQKRKTNVYRHIFEYGEI